MAKKKVSRKKKGKAAPKKRVKKTAKKSVKKPVKKTAKKPAKKRAKRKAKPAGVKSGYSAAELLTSVQKLEELTEAVREVASQLIRTEELQSDLLGNRLKQVSERDVLGRGTAVLTAARDKLVCELAKVSGATGRLQRELDALDKTIDKAETVCANLSARKDVLVSEKKALTADSKGLKARQKKCKAEIVSLTALKKQLIS